ncbi:hypothetical protein Droror1_Dr00012114 [Drosera rotundifolia]
MTTKVQLTEVKNNFFQITALPKIRQQNLAEDRRSGSRGCVVCFPIQSLARFDLLIVDPKVLKQLHFFFGFRRSDDPAMTRDGVVIVCCRGGLEDVGFSTVAAIARDEERW